MKFPSLFTRTPTHKRFSYAPRYYDPQEEERKEREERIRREIAREHGESGEETGDYRARITGAFHSARRRSRQSTGDLNSTMLRLGVLLFLTIFLIAFFTWGKPVLYSLLIFVPLYLYLKFRNGRKA